MSKYILLLLNLVVFATAQDFTQTIYVNSGDSRKAAHFRTNHSDGPYIQIGNDTFVHELQGQGILFSDKLRIAGKTINFTTKGTTSRMHLNLDGNVGIGTTNPKSKLHIGSSNPKITFGEQNGYQHGRYAIDMWEEKLKVTVPGHGTLMEFFGDSLKNSSVKIGTTTSPTKLEVNGSAKFVTYPENNVGIQFGHDNGNAPFIGNIDGDYGLNIVTKGEKRIHVATDGNVYIYSTLKTNGNDILLYSDNHHGIGIYYKEKPFADLVKSGPVVYGHTGGGLGTTTGEKKLALQWNEHQQVGINCAPQSDFHLAVKGKVKAEEIEISKVIATGLQIKGESNFSGTLKTNGNDILLYSDNHHGIGIYYKEKPFANLATSGPVVYGYSGGGLGTTTSEKKIALQWNQHQQVGINCAPYGDYHLAVKGKVIAEEIEVALRADWPDFVFADNYDLISLEEVEQQIKKNKHLPDIPSETEVKRRGIQLGKMQGKLLQKIEELTLYTIQQNKQIKSLKTEKREMQERIEKVENLLRSLLKK
ncbi:hypothetical protein [Candidatus Uabimicrobium amorphum]|uniref:hypothetical protein n=1 Tax=Uabimicrobium amorphum TaxID=2596890 RepID=UPI0034A44DB8